MSYDLHITRKEFHFDEEGEVITHDEWKKFILSDLQIVQDYENGDEDYLFLRSEESWPIFWDCSGCLSSPNPPKDLIVKMVSIARILDAHVEGDDGEIYGSEGEIIEHR